MKNLRTSLALLSILALAVVAAASGALQSSAQPGLTEPDGRHGHVDARCTVDGCVVLEGGAVAHHARPTPRRARAARDSGNAAGLCGRRRLQGDRAQLDANSVALSKAIASVYGPAAGKQFLDGKNLWRAHIKYFVDYTVALAKHDSAGQKKAVANLMTYIQVQAAFFTKATGLPKAALVNDLTAHVLQLKGQLDAYAKGDYAQSYALTDGAYSTCS